MKLFEKLRIKFIKEEHTKLIEQYQFYIHKSGNLKVLKRMKEIWKIILESNFIFWSMKN